MYVHKPNWTSSGIDLLPHLQCKAQAHVAGREAVLLQEVWIPWLPRSDKNGKQFAHRKFEVVKMHQDSTRIQFSNSQLFNSLKESVSSKLARRREAHVRQVIGFSSRHGDCGPLIT